MAASTLHTFLFRLGFDIAGLSSGGAAGRAELGKLAAAAQAAAATAAPASAAIRSIGGAAQQTAGMLNPLITNLNAANASTGILLTTQGAAAMRMREAASAAGPLVSAGEALVSANRAAAASAGPLVSAEQAAAGAMRAATAAAGPLVSSTSAAAAAMRASYAAAGPLVSAHTSYVSSAGSAAGAAGRFGIAMRGVRTEADMSAAAVMRAGASFRLIGAAGPSVPLSRMFDGVPGPALVAASASHKVADALDHVATRATFMNRVLSMAFAFSGGVAVTTLFGFLANAVLGFNSRLEQAHIAFGTLMGDTAKGDAFIKKMEDFANVTPFSFQGVEESAQRLLAMGFTAEQVLPTLRSVGDAVAALGGDTEKLNRITIALGQMATAGRVNAQDMRQLTEAGIPAWQMLADGIGKTVAQTRKMAEDGLIPASQALDILISTMESKYAGMMAKQARTLQGAFSTIRDMALITVSASVEPLFNALSGAMVGLADFLLSGGGKFIAPAIQAIGIALAGILIPNLYRAAVAAAAATGSFLGLTLPIMPLIIALTVLGTAWQENVGGIRDALGPAVGAIAGFASSILKAATATGMLTPMIILLATVITTRFIVSLIASGAALISQAALTLALGTAQMGLVGTSMAATIGIGRLTIAMDGLAARMAVLMAPITAIVVAFTLLIMNFDRVAQGTRVLQVGLIGLQKGIADLFAMIPGPQQDMFKGLSTSLQASIDVIKGDMASAEADINRKAAEMAGAGAGADPLGEFRVNFSNAANGIVADTEKLVDKFGTSLAGVNEASRTAGAKAMSEYAQGILEAQNAPLDAFETLKTMMKTSLTPAAEQARLWGILASRELAAGLVSQDPAVKAAADAVVKWATDRLGVLTGNANVAGMLAGKSWNTAFREGLLAAGSTRSEIIGMMNAMDPADVQAQTSAYDKLAATLNDTLASAAKNAGKSFSQMAADVASGQLSSSDAIATFIAQGDKSLADLRAMAQEFGASFMAEYAQALAQNSDAPLNAMKDLLAMQKSEMSKGAEETRLIGILISKQLADGMSSSSPQVVAQAVATTQFIMEQLNRLQAGAYAAGSAAIQMLAAGMISPEGFAAINKAAAAIRYAMSMATMIKTGDFSGYSQAVADLKAANNLVVPSFAAATAAANDWFKGLSTGAGKAKTDLTRIADAKDKLKEAFGEIKRAARSMFDEMHEKNLKAIDDAKDLKNAMLQGKVDQARDALSAKRNNERLFQMQKAVNEAKTAEERADAMIELADFQAELQIDAQQRVVDEQVKLNEAAAAEQKKAENKRYTEQVASFNRELATLQRYMLRHPEEWGRMQTRVLALLADHGVTYITAGTTLGKKFATGLRESVGDAVKAAREVAGAAAAAYNAKYKADTKLPSGVPTPPPVPKGSAGAGYAIHHSGLWKSMEDHAAFIQKDEMVVPAQLAGMLRTIAQGPISAGLRPSGLSATSASGGVSSAGSSASGSLGSPSGFRDGEGGSRTLVIQIGDQVVGEVIDRGLPRQGTIYARPKSNNPSGR